MRKNWDEKLTTLWPNTPPHNTVPLAHHQDAHLLLGDQPREQLRNGDTHHGRLSLKGMSCKVDDDDIRLFLRCEKKAAAKSVALCLCLRCLGLSYVCMRVW